MDSGHPYSFSSSKRNNTPEDRIMVFNQKMTRRRQLCFVSNNNKTSGACQFHRTDCVTRQRDIYGNWQRVLRFYKKRQSDQIGWPQETSDHDLKLPPFHCCQSGCYVEGPWHEPNLSHTFWQQADSSCSQLCQKRKHKLIWWWTPVKLLVCSDKGHFGVYHKAENDYFNWLQFVALFLSG